MQIKIKKKIVRKKFKNKVTRVIIKINNPIKKVKKKLFKNKKNNK